MKKWIAFLASALISVCAFAVQVNVNTASEKELETVKGIGPAYAKAIIEYRSKNGPFKTLEDVKKVSGIGDKNFLMMKDSLTISGGSMTPAKEPKGAAPKPTGMININTASQTDLEKIEGVGPAKAKAIIEYRSSNGGFKSVEELGKVKGFGDKAVADLKNKVTIK